MKKWTREYLSGTGDKFRRMRRKKEIIKKHEFVDMEQIGNFRIPEIEKNNLDILPEARTYLFIYYSSKFNWNLVDTSPIIRSSIYFQTLDHLRFYRIAEYY